LNRIGQMETGTIHQRGEAILLEELLQKEGNSQWKIRHDSFLVLVMSHVTPYEISCPTMAC
jgi:hypothetical protein